MGDSCCFWTRLQKLQYQGTQAQQPPDTVTIERAFLLSRYMVLLSCTVPASKPFMLSASVAWPVGPAFRGKVKAHVTLSDGGNINSNNDDDVDNITVLRMPRRRSISSRCVNIIQTKTWSGGHALF